MNSGGLRWPLNGWGRALPACTAGAGNTARYRMWVFERFQLLGLIRSGAVAGLG